MGRRFFRHGELPLVVLHLLAVRAMHGYELMGELSQLFGPSYRPSAGSVYPAVESLEGEGLVEGREQGGRRVYHLTRTGRAALERRRDLVAALELRTRVRLPGADGPDAALVRFTTRVGAIAPRLDAADLDRVLDGAATEIEALAAARQPTTRRGGRPS